MELNENVINLHKKSVEQGMSEQQHLLKYWDETSLNIKQYVGLKKMQLEKPSHIISNERREGSHALLDIFTKSLSLLY